MRADQLLAVAYAELPLHGIYILHPSGIFQKALLPNFGGVLPIILTDSSAKQSENPYAPMDVTVVGISTVFKLSQ